MAVTGISRLTALGLALLFASGMVSGVPVQTFTSIDLLIRPRADL